MIREICKDEHFLAQKAEPAAPEDLPAAADLLETLDFPQGGLCGHGCQHDRRQQAHHCRGERRLLSW